MLSHTACMQASGQKTLRLAAKCYGHRHRHRHGRDIIVKGYFWTRNNRQFVVYLQGRLLAYSGWRRDVEAADGWMFTGDSGRSGSRGAGDE